MWLFFHCYYFLGEWRRGALFTVSTVLVLLAYGGWCVGFDVHGAYSSFSVWQELERQYSPSRWSNRMSAGDVIKAHVKALKEGRFWSSKLNGYWYRDPWSRRAGRPAALQVSQGCCQMLYSRERCLCIICSFSKSWKAFCLKRYRRWKFKSYSVQPNVCGLLFFT